MDKSLRVLADHHRDNIFSHLYCCDIATFVIAITWRGAAPRSRREQCDAGGRFQREPCNWCTPGAHASSHCRHWPSWRLRPGVSRRARASRATQDASRPGCAGQLPPWLPASHLHVTQHASASMQTAAREHTCYRCKRPKGETDGIRDQSNVVVHIPLGSLTLPNSLHHRITVRGIWGSVGSATSPIGAFKDAKYQYAHEHEHDREHRQRVLDSLASAVTDKTRSTEHWH